MPSSPADTINVSALNETEWTKTVLTVPSEAGEIVRFDYDLLQQRMAVEDTPRNVYVKPRQIRCSSRLMAKHVRQVTTRFGWNLLVITKDDPMTAGFRIRIKHHLDDLARVGLCPTMEGGKDNKDEIFFKDLESRIIFASAEQKVAGRSFTAHGVLASEVAHWGANAGEIIGSIIPAVPMYPEGLVDLESTPNGASGPFYDYAMAAQFEGNNPDDLYRLHFYRWFDEPKYKLNVDEQIMESFSPSDEERELMARHDLTVGQVLWRRMMKREMSKTGLPFEQEYPEDLMSCFLLGGNSYFDEKALRHIMEGAARPMDNVPELGGVKFEGWSERIPGRDQYWVQNGLAVYEYPVPGEQYIVYTDPSEGHKHSDNGAIQVLHARTRHQVASLALKAYPNKLGAMACAIGAHYNNALLAIERNKISATVLKAVDLGYPNLYYEEDEEDPEKRRYKAGFFLTREHRERSLAEFKEDAEAGMVVIRDAPTIREMYNFTWEQLRKRGDFQWKAQASSGALDDRVLSLACANYLAGRVHVTAAGDRQVERTVRPGARWI
jgi:hypothetical protein